MSAAAVRILRENRTRPLGSRIPFTADGREYVAVLERHWNTTKGPHVGVSLFEPIPPAEQTTHVTTPIPPALAGPVFWLGSRSLKRLEGVDERLVHIVKRAIVITRIDFTVVEGLRSMKRQAELLKAGMTSTMNSRHLTGHAVDLAPWIAGAISWNWSDFHRLAPFVQAAAAELELPIDWGGNWPLIPGRSFPDGPHWQIPWGK